MGEAKNSLGLALRDQAKYAAAEEIFRGTLAISEKTSGPVHRDTAAVLGNLGLTIQAQGRYPEAEAYLRRSVAILEKAAGESDPSTATGLTNLGSVLHDQGKYAEAEPYFRRAVAISEKVSGPEHPATASALNNLSMALSTAGRHAEAEANFRRVFDIFQKSLGPNHPTTATSLNNLAGALREQGRYGEAEVLYRRALAIDEAATGPEHPGVAIDLNNLGGVIERQGRYGEAEGYFRRALVIDEKALGPDHPNTGNVVGNLAGALQEQGRLAEAGTLHRRAVRISEKALGPDHLSTAVRLNSLASLLQAEGEYSEAETLFRRSLGLVEKALGAEHRATAIRLNNLAAVLQDQGRHAEAEVYYRRSLAIAEKALGADHPDLSRDLSNFGTLLSNRGRHAEAEAYFRRALALTERSVGADHPDAARALNNLGSAVQDQQRPAEAETYYRRSLAINEKARGAEHPDTADALTNLASVLKALGRHEEAEIHHRRSLEIRRKRLPLGHPRRATGEAAFGRLLLENLDRPAEALSLLRVTGAGVAARSGSRSGAQRWAKDELDHFRYVFRSKVRAAWAVAGAPRVPTTEAPAALRAEAYEAAQWAVSSDAADALAKMSARFAGGAHNLGQLAGQREELLAQLSFLERQAERLYTLARVGDAARTENRRSYERVLGELSELDARISREFPAYAELTSPKPLSIAETQQLLRPDEGLLLVLVAPDAAYVWGVSRDKVAWARVEAFGEKALGESVRELRETLTPEAAANAPDDKFDEAAGGFDQALAHKLYDELVQPVEAAFAGKKTLITVATGALTTLPLAVLVTEPPSSDGPDDQALRNTPWLLDRYALASLPSVSSLKALRCHLVADPAERSPGCETAPKEDRRPSAVEGLTLVAFGAPVLSGRPARTGRGGPPSASSVFEGRLAVPERLRKMPSLPGSAEELAGVARRFPARARLVRRGAEATETAVKVRDRESLAGARYVVFSTHGLLAAESGPAAEPGLVLTPPRTASVEDDGFLTASEAAQLRLAADFVVLSACNTAAPDGSSGGEGLSGLARAFFYAGARSVLVSHWQVDDKATTALMLKTFAGVEGPARIGRAAAVQAAARAVRADPRWSHPAYWAAFTLVGDPVS